MKPFSRMRSRSVVLRANDIDTDRIIPARFLKVTSKEGLGEHLFADWPDFPRDDARGAEILVAGANFGCGSSREHAVWALVDFGIRAVIAPSFADIFRGNALENGLLPVALPADAHARVMAAPGAEVTFDLVAQSATLPDGTRASFTIDPFGRHCLMEGIDELEFLLEQDPAIAAFESTHA